VSSTNNGDKKYNGVKTNKDSGRGSSRSKVRYIMIQYNFRSQTLLEGEQSYT